MSVFRSCLDSYPYLLDDSSMTSFRFSLIDMSMEWNFCLTCFSGSLLEDHQQISAIQTSNTALFHITGSHQNPFNEIRTSVDINFFTPCQPGTPGVSFGHLTSKAWRCRTCKRNYRCSHTGTSAGRGLDGGWSRRLRKTQRKQKWFLPLWHLNVKYKSSTMTTCQMN